MTKFSRAIVLTMALFLCSCSTLGLNSSDSEVRFRDQNVPIRLIKRCTASVLWGGIRRKSENHRTFYSRYADLNGKKWQTMDSGQWRVYGEITILGDRRPYTIDISTHVEERPTTNPLDSNFKRVGGSKSLTSQLAYRLKTCLEKIKKHDVLEDFRAF